MKSKYRTLSLILAAFMTSALLPPPSMAEENPLQTVIEDSAMTLSSDTEAEEKLPAENFSSEAIPADEPIADEETVEEAEASGEPESSDDETAEVAEVKNELAQNNSEQALSDSGRRESTYDYTLKGDPFDENFVIAKTYDDSISQKPLIVKEAYNLCDENFFGVWDSSARRWAKQPKLDYDNYDLDYVEQAAKSGDYELAKYELYNYYILRQREWNLDKNVSSTKKDRLTADLLCKNFMYNANSGISPLELLYVDQTPKYVSADITSTIESYKGTRQYVSFFILATDKDGEYAEFWSREAGESTQAYLNLKVDGADITIPVSEDTYISGGANNSTNYGKGDRLYAQEDAIGTKDLINELTKRIYLKFDISQIRSTDNISAATLNIYGKNSADEGEKEVVLFYADESTWTEAEASMSKVTAQVIYSYDQDDTWTWEQPSGSGFRYPEELLRFNTWLDKLVKLYNLTGDEKYAYTALRQLMDFINVKGNVPRHLKTLDVALRTQTLPPYIMQLIESEYMTPEIFTAVMKYCFVEASAEQYFVRTGNWGMSEACGLYTVAAYYPEFKEAGQWLTAVKTRNDYLSSLVVRDDCTSTELSIGYVDYTIDCLTAVRKVATKLGITDGYYGDATVENIRKLGLGLFYTSLPGIKDNQVGDGYSHRGDFSSRMNYLADWFTDDEHLQFAATGEGTKPDFTSKYFPNGRKVVMRTSWDENAMYLFTDVDGGVGNHSHPDDNAIVAYAYGQYLLVDPLYGSYSSSTIVDWLKSTKAHNVVNVDGAPQSYNSSAAVGTVSRFETNGTYDFSTTDSPATPGISSYKRSVFFLRNKFWLVNDYLAPTGSGTKKYVQSWHFLPEAGIELDSSSKIVKTNLSKANIQVVPVNTTDVRASIVPGYYSEGQGSIINADYVEYTQNQSGNTVFNTILLPEDTGKDYEVYATELPLDNFEQAEASCYDFTIIDKSTDKAEHYQYFMRHISDAGADAKTDSHSTDASMLFVQLGADSSTLYTAAQDVRYVTNNITGDTIIKSDAKLPEIAYHISGSYAVIDGSVLTAEIVKENNLTLYAGDTPVSSVLLNGESVNHTLKNGKIYLGEVSDTDPSEPTPTPTPKPTSSPSHSSGGSSGGGGGYYVSAPTPTLAPDETPAPDKRTMSDEIAVELSGHWAEEEIKELYTEGIINGISENSLGLKNNVTRAEFAAMLVNLFKLEIPEYGGGFSDVSQADWYAGYIQAAYNSGIVSGYDGYFDPNGCITREQMAVMLAKAAEYADIEIEPEETSFTDSNSISSWAADSIAFAASAKLIFGRDDGGFAPQDNAKRDEAFAVIYRLKQYRQTE